jgi:hypothetical protein
MTKYTHSKQLQKFLFTQQLEVCQNLSEFGKIILTFQWSVISNENKIDNTSCFFEQGFKTYLQAQSGLCFCISGITNGIKSFMVTRSALFVINNRKKKQPRYFCQGIEIILHIRLLSFLENILLFSLL